MKPAKSTRAARTTRRATAKTGKDNKARGATKLAKAKPPTTGKAGSGSPVAGDDPGFSAVLAALVADPALTAVAEEFAANQMAGGRRKFGSRALKVEGKTLP